MGAQAEAGEDQGARRRVKGWTREGAGAAALSGFTLQWSRTIPPSATVLSPRPPSPPPLLQPRRHPRPPRPRPPPPPLAAIGRDSRPRHTSASAKHFLFDRFFPGVRAAATDAPAAVALCMCSLACIRCES